MKQIISTTAYKYLKKTDTILIDVRTEYEWQETKIPYTKELLLVTFNINNNISEKKHFTNIIKQISPKKTLVFICRSGKRSYFAGLYTKQLGYTECINIKDGFEGNMFGKGWKNNQLPIQSYYQYDK